MSFMAAVTLPDDGPLRTAGELDGVETVVPQITVDEYAELLRRAGIDAEPGWELLDGFIRRIEKGASGDEGGSVNPLHIEAIERLTDLRSRFLPFGCFLRVEKPLKFSETSAPFPDAAVLRGSRESCQGQIPTSDEAIVVIEAADASLSDDMNKRLRRYAFAGIPMYVVLRLRRRDAVVLTRPIGEGYAERRELDVEEVLSLPTAVEGVTVDILLADLLPPAGAIG